MGLTRVILIGFIGCIAWNSFTQWRMGSYGEFFLDGTILLMSIMGVVFLSHRLKTGYMLLAMSGLIFAVLFLYRLTRDQLFFPSGYLWLLSTMIFLLCLIKVLQLRRSR